MLSPRRFVAFLDGRYGNVHIVAFLAGEYGAHIHALSCDLLIERTYALKLQRKHGLKYEHFDLIQTVINEGFAGVHRGDLVFLYRCEQRHRWYWLVVKTAAQGEELWVKTFYSPRWKQAMQLQQRMRVLREHA